MRSSQRSDLVNLRFALGHPSPVTTYSFVKNKICQYNQITGLYCRGVKMNGKLFIGLIAISIATSSALFSDEYDPPYWNNRATGSDRWIPTQARWDKNGGPQKTGSDIWPSSSNQITPSSVQIEPGADQFFPGDNTSTTPPPPSSDDGSDGGADDQTSDLFLPTGNEQAPNSGSAAASIIAQPSEANNFPPPNYYSYPEQTQENLNPSNGPVPTIQTLVDQSSGTGQVPPTVQNIPSISNGPEGEGDRVNGSYSATTDSMQLSMLLAALDSDVTNPALEGRAALNAEEIYPLNTDTPVMEILYEQLSPQGKQMWLQLPPSYRDMATELAEEDAMNGGSLYNLRNPDQYVEKAMESYQGGLILPEE